MQFSLELHEPIGHGDFIESTVHVVTMFLHYYLSIKKGIP